MFKITIFAALFAIAMAGTAQAETPISACVARYAPTAVLSGSGSYHAFFLHIYDARLYTRAGTHGDVRPYALSLTYFRKLEGKKIAAKTIEEMKHVGAKEKSPLAAWQKSMESIFPDVKNGTTLTGIYMKSGKTVFCNGDKKIGEVADPDFGRYFFGVWLNEKTSAPVLRRQLLGIK